MYNTDMFKDCGGVMMNLYLSAAEYDYHTLLKVAEMAGACGDHRFS